MVFSLNTHLTFAATEDIASLLAFFFLDTAVPMLKWKRPRGEKADHSTDWSSRTSKRIRIIIITQGNKNDPCPTIKKRLNWYSFALLHLRKAAAAAPLEEKRGAPPPPPPLLKMMMLIHRLLLWAGASRKETDGETIKGRAAPASCAAWAAAGDKQVH